MSDGSERQRRGSTARLSGEDGGRGEAKRTERMSAGGDEWSQREPVNPGWRSERATGSRSAKRGPGGLPTSPQEFQLWLQSGGWRYIAGVAALVLILLIALLAYGRNDQRSAGLGIEDQLAPTSFAGVGVGAGSALTPIIQPTLAPTTPPAPKFFTVTGTGGQGLFLRPAPSTDGAPITTLPDGTRVEQVGEDAPGGDYMWRKVKAADGQEGWVAVDFLTPEP
ncbi:SH3 domain-containing protein [Oscillochloris sp. ZM17-4]|uniref:SH3 domain-containing protein n=1 Tax=Oscillochloris sp. ZM17-4 TaxID=2866714 RepID=UPI001C7389BC|nr:SH3 domain-containing protein [Oscillochloris sp. ZM17-4]MBX0326625.1 SH3 domain-containing protein [Oscillochloris sp. ZM17-4]